MSLLYAGPLTPGTTSRTRMEALRAMGFDVAEFDTDAYLGSLSFAGKAIELMTDFGPRVRDLNREFAGTVSHLRRPIAWLDKPYWMSRKTLVGLRAAGWFTVLYNTDALSPGSWRGRWVYRRLRSVLPEVDLYVTTNEVDFDSVKAAGRPAVLFTHLGYDHHRFNPSPLTPAQAEAWSNELLFVGHHEPATEEGVLALVEAGLPVAVFGSGWHRAKATRRLRGHVQPRMLDNDEYALALKGTKIGLCFVSKHNFNQTAGRSFEIPASGTFLLATRTPEHLRCFREGEEAEFFGDWQELVRKARFYLEHDDLRRRIAARGTQRCLASGYSWEDRLRAIWPQVREAFHAHRPSVAGARTG